MAVFSNATSLPEELTDAPQWAQDVYRSLPCMASYKDIGLVANLHRGTIANLCSKGKGPYGAEIFARTKLFPRLKVTLWLIDLAKSKQS